MTKPVKEKNQEAHNKTPVGIASSGVSKRITSEGNLSFYNDCTDLQKQTIGWAIFDEAFELNIDVLEGRIKKLSGHQYIGIYTVIYLMSSEFNLFRQLYERYQEKLSSYCDVSVMPSLQSKHDMVFFEEFRKRWSDYQLLIKSLSHLFGALEINYIPRCELKTLQEIGRQIFFEKVYDQLKDKTSDVIIEMIHREHEGGWIDGYLVRNEIDFFVSISNRDLKTYINDFEAQFLASTTTYYARKAADNISISTLLDYMIMVEECLERERKIAVQYFPSITEPKLLEIVGEQLLLIHSEQLFEKDPGFHILLADGRVEDLSRMYALFSKINKGLASMSEKFKKCVINDGMRLIKQAEDAASQKKEDKRENVGLQEQEFFRRLIELHDRYMNFIENCFMSHFRFHEALCGAFEVICNMTAANNSIPNIVCSFIENIFKGGDCDDLSEPTIEETFDKIVRFLSCVQDKYLFSEIYRKNLARRLLNDRNACGDHERSLLVKIKQQLGMQLTSKMEGMINDMKLARDKQIEFQNYLDAHPGEHPGVDLTVTVLTTGFWPTYKISDHEIPEEMSSSVEIFNRFYMSGTRNRKLIWLFNLSTSVVIGKFDARSIEMSLTTYQAMVLLLFNNSDRLNFKEIATQLKLSNDEVIRLLHSLSCSKYKILNKVPDNKIISVRDAFEFNSKFTNKTRMITIPMPSFGKKNVTEDVEKDRRYAIDAALVRIMKSRKVLGYQLLLSQCIQQLSARFVPDVKAIKKRIEDLIARDFLERDANDLNIFKYVA